jgi:hypothetical protein
MPLIDSIKKLMKQKSDNKSNKYKTPPENINNGDELKKKMESEGFKEATGTDKAKMMAELERMGVVNNSDELKKKMESEGFKEATGTDKAKMRAELERMGVMKLEEKPSAQKGSGIASKMGEQINKSAKEMANIAAGKAAVQAAKEKIKEAAAPAKKEEESSPSMSEAEYMEKQKESSAPAMSEEEYSKKKEKGVNIGGVMIKRGVAVPESEKKAWEEKQNEIAKKKKRFVYREREDGTVEKVEVND